MAPKSKKIGICRREIITPEIKDAQGKVIQKEVLGPLFMTPGDLRSGIKSALRKLWTSSTKRMFLEKVRFKIIRNDREVWGVKCAECGQVMAVSERAFNIKKDGKPSKIKKVVYDVDHLTGSPGFTEIEHLNKWTVNMFFGELQILCKKCHEEKTTGKK